MAKPTQPKTRGVYQKTSERTPEFQARLLAEAALFGNPFRIAKKHGVPTSTFEHWLGKAQNDPETGMLVEKYKLELSRQHWGESLSTAMRRTLDKLLEMIEGLEPTKENIELVSAQMQKMMDWEQRRAVIELETTRARQEFMAADANRVDGSTGDYPERPPNAQA